jgi:hypothetical protein
MDGKSENQRTGSGGSQGPPQPNRLFMKVIFSEVIFSLNCNAME